MLEFQFWAKVVRLVLEGRMIDEESSLCFTARDARDVIPWHEVIVFIS